ncbi:MAG: glycosyltransferase family 2 protein [Candidatus Coatesbacteria bacterium]|nr:MAG: glycosyltransferase family 2 protein [Candidatus Coatesbacteria bacterium]
MSVIIPCREEREYVESAVQSALASDWPADRMEVLVVDGMSTDGTRDVVAALAAADARVRLLDNEKLLAASALNVGLRVARGEYVLRLDAHGAIPPDHIKKGVAVLRAKPVVWAVGGPLDYVGSSTTGGVIAALARTFFSTGKAALRVGRKEGLVDAVPYPLWRREIFAWVGEFDESLARNEDDDYFYRLQRAGGFIYQTPAMRARYYVRDSFRKLFKQYYQYAFWKVVVARKHGRFPEWKPLVPPTFFGAVAAALAAGLIVPWAGYVAAALAGAYAVADVAASVAVGARAGVRGFIQALAVFPAFHLNYAAGLAAGFWYAYLRDLSPEEIVRRDICCALTR